MTNSIQYNGVLFMKDYIMRVIQRAHVDMECNGGDLRQPYHHNLLANNSSRSCRFNGARNTDLIVFIEYINNVNFNWGRSNSVYGGENTGNKNIRCMNDNCE